MSLYRIKLSHETYYRTIKAETEKQAVMTASKAWYLSGVYAEGPTPRRCRGFNPDGPGHAWLIDNLWVLTIGRRTTGASVLCGVEADEPDEAKQS